jgi:hypothetical protein
MRKKVYSTLQRTNTKQKFETNISRKGIAPIKSQFPHSFVRDLYFTIIYSVAGKMWTDPGNI